MTINMTEQQLMMMIIIIIGAKRRLGRGTEDEELQSHWTIGKDVSFV